MTPKQALERVIALCGGSQTELAKRITSLGGKKVSPNQIAVMLGRDKRASSKYALLIEQAVEGQVTRHQLRPDIFGKTKSSRPSSLASAAE